MGRGFVKGYGSILVSNGAQVYLMVVVLKGSGSDWFLRGVTHLVFWLASHCFITYALIGSVGAENQ